MIFLDRSGCFLYYSYNIAEDYRKMDINYRQIIRRTLFGLLIAAAAIGAMIAFILPYKRIPPAPPLPPAVRQPASFGNQAWPIFRGDAALTGQAAGTLPDKLKPDWTFKTKNAVKSTPIVADNKTFISSMDSCLYALELHTGREIWRFEADEALEASPVYHNGMVYVGSNRGTFYAVKAQTGQLVWSCKTDGKITGSANIAVHPKTDQTLVIFGSYDNNLYAVDAAGGQIVFQYPARNYINGAIAAAQNTAAFGSCDANLYLVPIDAPEQTRTIDAGSYVAANPVLFEGVIYAGNYDGVFLAADAAGGSILWRFDKAEDAFFSSPAVNDRVVVVGCRDGKVYCFSRQSGKLLWTFAAQDSFDSSPLLCGDKAAVGCSDGRLYLLDINSGKELFAYTLGGSVSSSPAAAQNRLLVGCEDGSVYTFVQAD